MSNPDESMILHMQMEMEAYLRKAEHLKKEIEVVSRRYMQPSPQPTQILQNHQTQGMHTDPTGYRRLDPRQAMMMQEDRGGFQNQQQYNPTLPTDFKSGFSGGKSPVPMFPGENGAQSRNDESQSSNWRPNNNGIGQEVGSQMQDGFMPPQQFSRTPGVKSRQFSPNNMFPPQNGTRTLPPFHEDMQRMDMAFKSASNLQDQKRLKGNVSARFATKFSKTILDLPDTSEVTPEKGHSCAPCAGTDLNKNAI
eukprot:CAMPEP_0197524778 /NCGR_PEP_ID=MMETSP1318-20131121/9860_1 /TAXON_ID=552666 /ORGANISM="Partenskyella glossopodia, Strain RCC365" /LENGTH=250 /DNA_ID=CAMNT_0043077813 /DNA_START=82 /DNA_END=835 /DNA_ORIENTATION=-